VRPDRERIRKLLAIIVDAEKQWGTDARLGIFARASAAVRFPRSGHSFVVIRAELPRGSASALVPQDRGGVRARLLQEIVSERERGSKIFTCGVRAVLWELRRRFQDQIGFGDQILERLKRTTVGCHTSTVRRPCPESNRKLFFNQRRFQTLPNQLSGNPVRFI
jgi:hypothetical protein